MGFNKMINKMINTKKGKKIKIFMLQNGIRNKNVANELNIHPCAVSRFLNGHFASKKITKYFLDKGCPIMYFKNYKTR